MAAETVTRQETLTAAYEAAVAETDPSTFAGGWIDHANNTVVVAVTRPGDAPEQAAGATVREKVVTRSAADLKAVQDKVDAIAARHEAGAGSWYVDSQANVVKVEVEAGGSSPEFLAAVRALGDGVRLSEVPAGPAAIGREINSADEVQASNGIKCSHGFRVKTFDGKWVLLTAGHCIGNAQGKTWIHNGVLMGTSGDWRFDASGDWGIIRYDYNSRQHPEPWVNRYGPSTVQIKGMGRVPGPGSHICKSGRSTKTTCGEVLQHDVSVNYGSPKRVVKHLISTDLCGDSGDSGGPVYNFVTPAPGVVRALGMSVAASRSGVCTLFFQPLDRALAASGTYWADN
ncbi:S1 family peptidase [Micromonospora lutea]|uniref:S1 family peptidase n=1 Tax=Micromonospora lutea TaxID=419825 RepID=UPI00194F341A|nr:S1 family peptidase [Micromonospora lutea]